MELILAGLARHLWQTLVNLMHNAEANVAILNSLNFPFNVGLPSENG
jgi:hypothetical protein